MSENSYILKFTPKANGDLEQIYAYVSGKLFSEIAADNLLERLENSLIRLRYFPYSCSFVSDEPLKNKGYRKLIVDNYIAFYLVNETEKQVVVMRILYGAQNYENLL